jgi:molybdopterin-guanine dinucleotide biosynthesis protein A
MAREYDAIVLAGGTARRLGGADKATLPVAGRTLLDRVLDVLAGAGQIVVVGAVRPVERPVQWTRESPPGGGPVAALGAGLALSQAARVLVLACDLPLITTATVQRLLAALERGASGTGADAAMLVDPAGRRQPLLAVYDRCALAAALVGLGEPAGRSMRALVAGLDVVEVAAVGNEALDCDTWVEVSRSTLLLSEEGT